MVASELLKIYTIQRYTEEYRAKPWYWRLRNYVRWVSSTIWSVVRKLPAPGEQILLEVVSQLQEELKQVQEELKQASARVSKQAWKQKVAESRPSRRRLRPNRPGEHVADPAKSEEQVRCRHGYRKGDTSVN